MNIKREILEELDSRIYRIQNHKESEKVRNTIPEQDLSKAVSRIVEDALVKEIKSIRDFVQDS